MPNYTGPTLRTKGLCFSWACLLLGSCLSFAACSSSSDTPAAGGGDGGGAGGGGSAPTGGKNGTAGDGGKAGSAAHGGSAGGGSQAGKDAGGGGSGGAPTAGASNGGSEQVGGSSDSGGESGTGEFGFEIRKPGEKNLDFLCTFKDGSDSGHVYARLLQTGTQHVGIAETPVYSVELAQISINGAVSALQGAKYDYGGGHHNDSLSFDHSGKTERYYHSSFGFGFRSCQPMDCRNVYALGTTTLDKEGCAKDRSLPEVCVSIKPDGTHDPLDDAFMKCQGDSQ